MTLTADDEVINSLVFLLLITARDAGNHCRLLHFPHPFSKRVILPESFLLAGKLISTASCSDVLPEIKNETLVFI